MQLSIIDKIKTLKEQCNAIILAHYYVNDEIQDIADYIGDSFYLSKVATTTKADVIVFCGVSFMGESAKLLNPQKTVLMPDLSADCAMAHMCDVEKIQLLKKQYEDLAVVCYINSTAELKRYSDVCVTSANALKIVRELPNKNIFFIPDENLGRYVASLVPEKHFIFNDGFCPIHKSILPDQIQESKRHYPDAMVLAHPECTPDVLRLADYIGSTSGIIQYVKDSGAEEFIIATEIGVFHQLKKENPDKRFYPACPTQVCRDMKLITLKKIADVLEHQYNQVELTNDILSEANAPLNRMLELANA